MVGHWTTEKVPSSQPYCEPGLLSLFLYFHFHTFTDQWSAFKQVPRGDAALSAIGKLKPEADIKNGCLAVPPWAKLTTEWISKKVEINKLNHLKN